MKILLTIFLVTFTSVSAEENDPYAFLDSYTPAEPGSAPPSPKQMPWETNYWECILDEMPGTQTKAIAYSIRKKCNQYKKYYNIEKKSPLWGVTNATECTIKYGKETPSNLAVKIIRQACNTLYVQ